MVRWTWFELNEWKLRLLATDKGLCYVSVPREDSAETKAWVSRAFPGCAMQPNEEIMRPYVLQLREYFLGERKQFDFPLDLRGTVFQKAVWNALLQIPFGETRSYSDIAVQIGKPSAVRAVGQALGSNPLLIVVPCHRVIGKDGSLTGFGGGIGLKKKLLQHEGAFFRTQGR